ncbi:hypothetical protein TRVL_07568 [Trypanosoma vivax]|nr:hypothetical protein TRVL_07568 [Trypanosoma vivax]
MRYVCPADLHACFKLLEKQRTTLTTGWATYEREIVKRRFFFKISNASQGPMYCCSGLRKSRLTDGLSWQLEERAAAPTTKDVQAPFEHYNSSSAILRLHRFFYFLLTSVVFHVSSALSSMAGRWKMRRYWQMPRAVHLRSRCFQGSVVFSSR